MIITTEGILIRLVVNGISNLGRITSGVKLINMDADKDITVASIAKVRDNNTQTSEEDVIKQLEQELEEEIDEIPSSDDNLTEEDDELAEDYETEDNNLPSEDLEE